MAKAASTPRSLQSKKTKKIKTTRTEQYLINIKYMGLEPEFTSDRLITDLEYSNALTWYNYMCSRGEARTYLETYLKNTGRDKDLKLLKQVPDNRFSEHVGWIARLLSRGVKVSDKTRDTLEIKLKNMFAFCIREPKVVVESESKKVINIQDRIKDKCSDFIGLIEETIDSEGYTVSVYDMFQKHELPAAYASRVAEFYKPIAEEALEVLKKTAPLDLKEGYNHLTKEECRARAIFYNTILDDCVRYAGNVKKQRKQREPKPLSVDKKLKHFKYLKEDQKQFKVVSINPEKILKAQELWAFNTKYNTLTGFYAIDRGGLDIDRMSITKFDEEKTKTYKVNTKKSNDVLKSILTDSKRALGKTLSTLKEFPIVQHRINENVLLLKVVV